MLNFWLQVIILIFGPLTIILVSGKSTKVKCIGFCVGILHQPAWFYASYLAGQWGMMGVATLYAFAYINGIYNHSNWSKDEVERHTLTG